jgi:hypothetical protein
MSRKTTRWRRLGRQAGEGNTSQLEPHRATGRARFRCVELDDITLERAFGKVCCRPMGDEKLARFRKCVESGASPNPAKKGWR